MRRPAGRWNFTVNGKPAAVDVPPPTAGAKPVSRSSHAKGLRRRAGAHLRRSCHANPIRWLADGFAGSNPTCPATQSVCASATEAVIRPISPIVVWGPRLRTPTMRLSSMLTYRQRRAAGRAAQCRRASCSPRAPMPTARSWSGSGRSPAGRGSFAPLRGAPRARGVPTPPRAPIRFCQKRLQLFDQP